jgi:hypothetical protein
VGEVAGQYGLEIGIGAGVGTLIQHVRKNHVTCFCHVINFLIITHQIIEIIFLTPAEWLNPPKKHTIF